MEIRFEKKYLQEIYKTGKTNDKKHRFQPQVINGYLKCVKVLDEAQHIEELFQYHSLRYEKLSGNKKGLSSLRINNQYRLEFREIPGQTDEAIIEICSLIDITNHYK